MFSRDAFYSYSLFFPLSPFGYLWGYYSYPAAEKRLLWKFDVRILPMLALLCLFNGLNKGNLGNAKTNGLTEDLGLAGDQYNILLSVSPSVGSINAKGISPNAGV